MRNDFSYEQTLFFFIHGRGHGEYQCQSRVQSCEFHGMWFGSVPVLNNLHCSRFRWQDDAISGDSMDNRFVLRPGCRFLTCNLPRNTNTRKHSSIIASICTVCPQLMFLFANSDARHSSYPIPRIRLRPRIAPFTSVTCPTRPLTSRWRRCLKKKAWFRPACGSSRTG